MNARRTRPTLTIAPIERLDDRLVLSTITPHFFPMAFHPTQSAHAAALGHFGPSVQISRPVANHFTAHPTSPVYIAPASQTSTMMHTTTQSHITPSAASTSSSTPSAGTAMTKANSTLNSIYNEYAAYVQGGSKGNFVSSQVMLVAISNGNVNVDVRVAGDLNAVAGQMKQLGMVVTGVDAPTGTIEGSLPIGQLPAVANDAFVIGISPVYRPTIK